MVSRALLWEGASSSWQPWTYPTMAFGFLPTICSTAFPTWLNSTYRTAPSSPFWTGPWRCHRCMTSTCGTTAWGICPAPPWQNSASSLVFEYGWQETHGAVTAQSKTRLCGWETPLRSLTCRTWPVQNRKAWDVSHSCMYSCHGWSVQVTWRVCWRLLMFFWGWCWPWLVSYSCWCSTLTEKASNGGCTTSGMHVGTTWRGTITGTRLTLTRVWPTWASIQMCEREDGTLPDSPQWDIRWLVLLRFAWKSSSLSPSHHSPMMLLRLDIYHGS